MPLKAKIFAGDPQLEAAAVLDSAHILPGARGDHVQKIQQALIDLDGAGITADSIYGPATAAAVLAYKQKRNIINPAYQTQADNIVGKMTMASLDAEMAAREVVPRNPVQIKPGSTFSIRQPRPFLLAALIEESEPLALAPATNTFAVGGPGASTPKILAPNISPAPVLELRRNSVGKVFVIDGAPGDVTVADTAIVKIRQDAPLPPGATAPVSFDSETFFVFSGKTLGTTKITATSLGKSASIDVVVKTFFAPPNFDPGVNHNHLPSGRYADVQANPNNGPGFFGTILDRLCPVLSKEALITAARGTMFLDKPVASQHLDHYLTLGKGADFVEDANIRAWLLKDPGIQRRLKREIFKPGKRTAQGQFFFDQGEYDSGKDGQDFRFAFGSIDKVNFEVDFAQDTVRVFFQDRYEWHPVYPFYSLLTGDAPPRDTNCLHAALVEMKTSGAADYWMKGAAEVNLSTIAKP